MTISKIGYTPKTSQEVLKEVQNSFTSTFGSGFVLSPSSINGQLIQFNTLSAIEVEDTKSIIYGSLYNPYLASGVWLDALCKFNNIKRREPTSSAVSVLVTGLAGTIIGINSKILSTQGDIFYNKEVILINSTGTGTGVFYSEEKGKIACNSGTINQIITTIAGWDTVNNPTDGVVGTLEESDQNLRNRRSYSLAINSAGSINSVISALNENENILNFAVQENSLAIAQTIQGVSIEPHCIYVSIYTNYTDEIKTQIADILFSKRYCTMQGDTSFTITDEENPHVQFTAYWQTAKPRPIQINLSLQNSSSYPPDIETKIKQVLIANWNGEFEGIAKYRMQDVINVSRFYPSLISIGVYLINSLTIQFVTDGTPTQQLAVPLDEVMTLSEHDIKIQGLE